MSNKPKRLVHVIESCSGGSLQYVINICRLLGNEWVQHVIFSRRADTPQDLVSIFPEYVTLHEVTMTREVGLSDIRGIAEVKRLLLTMKPDLIHLHSSKAGAVGRIAGFLAGYTTIYTPHGFSFFRRDIGRMKKTIYWLFEYILSKIPNTYFLIGSDIERRAVIKLGKLSKAQLIYNSVKIINGHRPSKHTNHCFVTIGRITAAKNPYYLIDIIKQIAEKQQVDFIWVGDGEEREKVELYAAKQNVSVTITGWLSHDAVQNMLNQATVYVQASAWEALPLSVLEAMAAEKAIVVSDIEAHRDIITHGYNGFVASSKTEFVRYITDLLNSPELSKTIGREALRTIQDKYSNEHFKQSLVRYYTSILDGSLNDER